MPRISDPAPAESTSNTAQPATASPIVVVPMVQIPAPAATQSRVEPSAPEVTSDAETLALPGIPGAKDDEALPSPTEEEGERAMVDPYVSTVEGVTTEETAHTGPPPAPALTEHGSASASSGTRQGFGGLVPVIPRPISTEGTEECDQTGG